VDKKKTLIAKCPHQLIIEKNSQIYRFIKKKELPLRLRFLLTIEIGGFK